MTPQMILGTSLPVFIGVTLVLMCGCAILMGRALASSWRPARHAVPYGLLLAAADRFLIYALFDGDITSPGGALIDTYCILFSALIAYRLTLVAQMVRQYPWLYERVLLFGWRARPEGLAGEG
jgi:branched-chain amino acid transport system ATP-binding protein